MSQVTALWSLHRSRRVPHVSPAPRRGSERGSVLPLLALLVVAVGGLCLGLGRLGGDAVEAAQARTAADAAALAGAAEGESAAREVAIANGGEVVGFAQEGPEVQVRARVGDAEAVARATRTSPGPADLSQHSLGWAPEGP